MPDGTPVRTVSAQAEATGLTSADERQLWARLDGLGPDTIYCYALRDASGPLTLRTGFRTAPTADPARPVRFLAFGDSGGGGADQYALLEQMDAVPYELILHTGDLAYDKGTMRQLQNTVFRVYSGLLRNIPFFPVAGTHDYGTLNGQPFRDVFSLPGDAQEKWYSFDWDQVHSPRSTPRRTTRPRRSGSSAISRARDLASSALPWKIVYLHKPMGWIAVNRA